MTRYLLDTTVLIDFAKGRDPACSRVMNMIAAGDELGVTPLNVAEFYAGLPPSQRVDWDEFFGALNWWPVTWESSRQAGCWRHDFARQGRAITTAHALIAAVANEQSAIIATGNVQDYPMPDVRLLEL